MTFWEVYLVGLLVSLALAVVGWLGSLALRNVNLVDSLWSQFFLAATLTYLAFVPATGPRAALTLALVALWSLRLSTYLTIRNWGKPEDRRYQAIRARNSPGFAWKSLYLIFGLQAMLAWLISLPLLVAVSAPAPLNVLDLIGICLILFGLVFETVADAQLARFKRDPANRERVLDRGLWRYSRHPNYFGEACVWWGFGLLAVAAGAWWALASPLMMTFLLLKVSGVVLLERDIAERRPAYRDYIARTSAFIPWVPRRVEGDAQREVAP